MTGMTPPHYIDRPCQKCGGEIQGWTCQGCGQVFRENDAGSLVFAPMEAVAWREKVARIIDPKGWETRDRQYKEITHGLMHDKDKPLAYANADYYTRDSRSKADAILQALAVIPTQGGEGRDAGGPGS